MTAPGSCALLPGPDCSVLVLPSTAALEPAPSAPEVPVPWYVSRLPSPGMGIFFLVMLALYALQSYQAR